MRKTLGMVLLTLMIVAPARARDAADRTQTIDINRDRSENRIERLRQDRALDAKTRAESPAPTKIKPKTNKKSDGQ
jgi:hypothetical protein